MLTAGWGMHKAVIWWYGPPLHFYGKVQDAQGRPVERAEIWLDVANWGLTGDGWNRPRTWDVTEKHLSCTPTRKGASSITAGA